MYYKLAEDFKKELIDRQLDIMNLVSFSILFFIYIVALILLWNFFNHWLVILLCNLGLIILCIIIAYTIIFIIAKKKNKIRAKDYFKFKHVIKSLNGLVKNDVQILSSLLLTHGINTTQKLQETINHFRFLLLRKSNNGFAIGSVLSLTLSVLGMIFSTVKQQSNQNLFIILLIISSSVFCITLICILIKIIYRSICYNLSNYALYERIEVALSEILIRELI